MILELFIFFFKIGAFSFGGGYAMIPLISQEVVYNKGWITSTELVDMIAVSQMTPGPISINLATYVGYQQMGILGSLAATSGVVMPSFIIMSVFWLLMRRLADNLYFSYFMEGIRPIVIGLILSGLVSILPSSIIDAVSLIIFLASIYLIHVKDLNPILAIVIGAILGILIY